MPAALRTSWKVVGSDGVAELATSARDKEVIVATGELTLDGEDNFVALRQRSHGAIRGDSCEI